MPMTNAEKQKAYRERKKEKDGESYLEKERQRIRGYYVPIAERSKTDQEKRRKKVRKLVQKHREMKKQSTNEITQQGETSSPEQEPVVSSSTDGTMSTTLVVRLPCQNPKNRTRKRISRQVAKCNREIERLSEENINTHRKYKTVSKRYERLVKKTTAQLQPENSDQNRESSQEQRETLQQNVESTQQKIHENAEQNEESVQQESTRCFEQSIQQSQENIEQYEDSTPEEERSEQNEETTSENQQENVHHVVESTSEKTQEFQNLEQSEVTNTINKTCSKISTEIGTEKLTPRKRMCIELRNEGVSPSKIPKTVKNKLVLANVLTDEIQDMYQKSDQQGKTIITSMLSSRKLKKYRLKQTLSKSTGIRRSSLTRKKDDLTKIEKRKRNPIQRANLRKDIEKFLERDDNSRAMPGKNDKAKIEKGHVQKRILNDNMAFLHLKYKAETASNVSFSRFCAMRPKHIGLTKYLGRNKCLCQKHQNMALALKSMKKAGAGVPLNPDEFIRNSNDNPVDTYLSSISDEEVVYSQWEKVEMPDGRKKTVIVDKTLKKDDFNSKITKQICEFSEHVQRVKSQYAAISTLKENLPQGHLIIQMDFAENLFCSSVDEVQSAYWNGTAVTLHPVVVYFKDDMDKMQHKNFVYVSDDLGHNFGAVYSFIKDIVNEMKETICDLQMVHYWTDSPSSQYRNKSAFFVVSDHKNLLGVPAIWNYFETGHGKGPCDGIGGTSKRTADLAIRQGKFTIQDASDYFKNVGPLHTSASYRFMSSKDIDTSRKEVNDMNMQLKLYKGTMQVHQVTSVCKGKVRTCTTSCYCDRCIIGNLHNYSEGTILKQRRDTEQSTERVVQEVVTVEENGEPDTTIQEENKDENEQEHSESVTTDEPHTEINKGDWLAVSYQNEWHIGKVEMIDSDDELEVSFLRPERTDESKSLYKWPSPRDFLNMERDDTRIICKIQEPVRVGRSGRSYKLFEEDKQKILQRLN